MKKYQIIGGQYEQYWYGESNSLHGAKIIATENKEYWDNWQGWHTPMIYDVGDVEEILSKGRITTPDGWPIRVAKPGATPIARKNEYSDKWECLTVGI